MNKCLHSPTSSFHEHPASQKHSLSLTRNQHKSLRISIEVIKPVEKHNITAKSGKDKSNKENRFGDWSAKDHVGNDHISGKHIIKQKKLS